MWVNADLRAQDFSDFDIETTVRSGRPYATGCSECLAQIGYRVKERGLETTFAVTDEDRTR